MPIFFASILIKKLLHTGSKCNSGIYPPRCTRGHGKARLIVPFLLLFLSIGLDTTGVLAETTNEPFSLASLDPEPIVDALEDFRDFIRDKYLDDLIDAYEESGLDDFIDAAEDSFDGIVASIAGPLSGLVNAVSDGGEDSENFFEYVATLIEDKTDEIFSKISLQCGESDSTRRSLEGLDGAILEGANNFLRTIGEATGNVGPVKVETTLTRSPTKAPIPTVAPAPGPDSGAIALNVGYGGGFKFQRQKGSLSGLYVEGTGGIGFDFGVLLDSGDSKINLAAGFGIAIGGEPGPAPTPGPTIVCPYGNYLTKDNSCKPCQKGYYCSISKAILCPKNNYCNGDGLFFPCDVGVCPTEGYFKSLSFYNTVCDKGATTTSLQILDAYDEAASACPSIQDPIDCHLEFCCERPE